MFYQGMLKRLGIGAIDSNLKIKIQGRKTGRDI